MPARPTTAVHAAPPRHLPRRSLCKANPLAAAAPPPPPPPPQVLSSADFRLQTVIEAAMEIAGLHAAQKRLQVAYNIADSGTVLVCVSDCSSHISSSHIRIEQEPVQV